MTGLIHEQRQIIDKLRHFILLIPNTTGAPGVVPFLNFSRSTMRAMASRSFTDLCANTEMLLERRYTHGSAVSWLKSSNPFNG
jgi:hypothetical protein